MMITTNHRSRIPVSYLLTRRVISRVVLLWFMISYQILSAYTPSDSLRTEVKSDSLIAKQSSKEGKIFIVEGTLFYDVSKEISYDIVIVKTSADSAKKAQPKELKKKTLLLAKKETPRKSISQNKPVDVKARPFSGSDTSFSLIYISHSKGLSSGSTESLFAKIDKDFYEFLSFFSNKTSFDTTLLCNTSSQLTFLHTVRPPPFNFS